MARNSKKQKEDFKELRDAANKADMSSSKALQDDALTRVNGKSHDDLKRMNKDTADND